MATKGELIAELAIRQTVNYFVWFHQNMSVRATHHYQAVAVLITTDSPRTLPPDPVSASHERE